MSNLVKSGDFTHELFGTLNVIKNEADELYFVGKEVCDILGYSNPSKTLADHCKGTITFRYETNTNGGNPNILIIPERDLYRLIMRSKKEEAERFEEWVVGEVLPTIRKTGSYSVAKTEEDTILDLFPTTDVNLVKLVANTIRENKEQKRLLIEQKPKVEFYDEIIDAKETFDFSAVAKLMKLKYGRNTLFNKLREAKVLMSDNEPYQQYMGTYFMIVEAKWNNPKTGSSHAVKQTRVTQRGIEWLTKNKDKFNL